ncbi:hypothetical protein BGX38DRAFT_1278251 [Terfezia claveryi]|nr:hypothetical protein BGX38DRAFT_1278251 [Terfezia claveryi]
MAERQDVLWQAYYHLHVYGTTLIALFGYHLGLVHSLFWKRLLIFSDTGFRKTKVKLMDDTASTAASLNTLVVPKTRGCISPPHDEALRTVSGESTSSITVEIQYPIKEKLGNGSNRLVEDVLENVEDVVDTVEDTVKRALET